MFLVIMTHMLYNYFCLFKNFYFLPVRQPTRVLLPGKSHGRRSLLGCSPWGRWGSDMTERLHFHFSLPCIGEGMATHSSVLAWRIPGTGEPDWSDLAAAAAGFIKNCIVGTVVVWILHSSFICRSSLIHSDWIMKNFIPSIRKEEDWILPLHISQKFDF